MLQLPQTLDRAIHTSTRIARLTEFIFRRADVSGDIYPDDDDHGVVAGPDPVKVVFLGEAGEISLGVRTHELSLAAFFARKHAAATRRGVDWQIHAFPSSRLTDAVPVVDVIKTSLLGTNVVVLLIGITDALRVIPVAIWDTNLRTALNALTECIPPDAQILIGEMPPLDNAGSLSRPARTAAGLLARTLNARTRAVATDYPQVTVIPFPDELTKSLWRPKSEENKYTHTYKTWAGHLAQRRPRDSNPDATEAAALPPLRTQIPQAQGGTDGAKRATRAQ